MRLKEQIGKKWLVYSFSATGKKMNSLPDFENWFQVQTPLGNTMHVKKGDIGLTVSQGTHTIIASISETMAESDAKIDGLIKDLDAIEMPVPMGVRKNLMSVVAIANRAENPEEFFQSIFG